MSPGPTTDELIASHNFVAAARMLRAQRDRSSRVYGLNEALERVERVIADAGTTYETARQLVAEGHARRATVLLRRIRGRVADHEDVNALLEDCEARFQRSREFRKEGETLIEQMNWRQASEVLQQALTADPESKTCRERLNYASSRLQESQSAVRDRRLAVLAGALTLVVVIGALAGGFFWRQRLVATLESQGQVQAKALADLEASMAYLENEQYVEAQELLETSLEELRDAGLEDSTVSSQTSAVLTGPRLGNGLAGKVPFEGRWVLPEQRAEELTQREWVDRRISSLAALIEQQIAKSGLEENNEEFRLQLNDLKHQIALARAAFTERRFERAEAKLLEVDNRVRPVFLDMGLVTHEGEWVTAKEAERRQMLDRGFVWHGGEWITQKEKFALEQQAKGLEQFEGEWRTKEEIASLKAERERLRNEAERVAREEQAKRDAERLALYGRDAYLMSREFVKDRLKSPTSAVFPPFDDSDVMVRNAETDGYFVVVAYVDAANAFGAVLRRRYMCVLKPSDEAGQKWQASSTLILE